MVPENPIPRVINQNIAFAYSLITGRHRIPHNHDRCDRSAQMRLYKLQKGEIGALFFVFLNFCAWIFLIGKSGPPVTQTYMVNATRVANLTGCGNGPFAIQTETMTRFNRKFWLYAVFRTEDADEETYNMGFIYIMKMFGLVDEGKERISVPLYPRRRQLSCVNKTCNPVRLAHVSHILYPRYEFEVGFMGLEHFYSKYRVKDVQFYVRTYTEEHSYMQISFACIFMTTTLFALFWYQKSLKAYNIGDWSYEQQWTYFLLIGLFLFNGPFFAATYVASGWIAEFALATCQLTFLTHLIGFWICLYHALRCSVRNVFLFYMPKIFLVTPIWMFAMCHAYYKTAFEGPDPSFFANVDTNNTQFYERGLYISLATNILVLAYYGIRAYLELYHLPHFNRRLNFATISMGMITSIAIALKFVNIHGVNIVQDELVGDLNLSFDTFTGMTTFFGFLNFYVYMMAFVYSPPPATQTTGQGILKDNPALSMMNDSDGYVVFMTEKPKNKNRQSGIAIENE